MAYRVSVTDAAKRDITRLAKTSPTLVKKLGVLLDELKEHPRTGTGQCERLRHFDTETWSRRINKEHRLVYQIHDDVVEVLGIAAFGHYA